MHRTGRWIVVIVVLLLLGTASVAEAQTVCNTSPCGIQANKPFQVAADHDGVETLAYRLYVNGTILQTLPVTALQTGVITFSVPSLPRGTYVIYVEAIGDGGAASGSDLTLNATPGKPKAPTNTRTIQGS